MVSMLYHVNVNCSALERSVEFYRRFGFEVVSEFPPMTPEALDALALARSIECRGVLLGIPQDGHTFIDLLEWGGGVEDHVADSTQSRVGAVRLALKCDDLDEDLARLAEAGIEPIGTPAEFAISETDVCRFACFADPDGLVVELIAFATRPVAAVS